ncbi:bacteriophage-type DNA polymerase N-terminal domain protein [Cyanobium sp. PCC 7001]|uniref:uracil-DNA glycosylase n=1 Tax=Cyanobium sp. PCC 7001 TaxID=180281 RepID=UPI00018053E7|nr:uracil-DNA glycosylase [Cyanobium sp. PCC 7001]EDY39699.1 bacteriophage-type DNA polymerase N-terminal domain protein [Cyanobium sp. PCC 7001]
MPPPPTTGETGQPDLFGPLTPSAGPSAGPASGSGLPAVEPDLDLAGVAAACAACRRCGLAATRQHVVVSRGDPAARLMVIGEGPGAQEDASGQPFVGRAGQLLDQMLASVGIDSNRDAYICNVVKCRPPENRKPTPAEMAACRPWLDRQIQLNDPAVILLAGATAMEGVLGVKGGITRLRGQWRQGSGPVLAGRWLMPIFHPSYLLRNPSRQSGSPKWLTWQDLQDVRRRLDQGGTRRSGGGL